MSVLKVISNNFFKVYWIGIKIQRYEREKERLETDRE